MHIKCRQDSARWVWLLLSAPLVDISSLSNKKIVKKTLWWPFRWTRVWLDITVTSKGIEKLLYNLNPHKAAGPDKIKPIILKKTFDPTITNPKTSLPKVARLGNLLPIWKDVNVAPVYKRGERSNPANYRPISLTCILCKTLEHIVASSITKHLSKLNIFYELQHGFREKRSCESQLILLVDDLFKPV